MKKLSKSRFCIRILRKKEEWFMFLFIVLLTVIPAAIVIVVRQSIIAEKVMAFLAVISTIVFAAITMSAIQQILLDQTVFMTSIHGVFLDPLFLTSGGYVLFFFVYRLMYHLLEW